MAWAKLQSSGPNHPKFGRLARALGVPRAQAYGCVAALWAHCAAYAPTGALAELDDLDIAAMALWDGDAAVFVRALLDARLLDDDRTVHGYADNAGSYAEEARKRAEAERKRRARAGGVRGQSSDASADSPRTILGPSAENPPLEEEREREEEREEEEEEEEEEIRSACSPADRLPVPIEGNAYSVRDLPTLASAWGWRQPTPKNYTTAKGLPRDAWSADNVRMAQERTVDACVDNGSKPNVGLFLAKLSDELRPPSTRNGSHRRADGLTDEGIVAFMTGGN